MKRVAALAGMILGLLAVGAGAWPWTPRAAAVVDELSYLDAAPAAGVCWLKPMTLGAGTVTNLAYWTEAGTVQFDLVATGATAGWTNRAVLEAGLEASTNLTELAGSWSVTNGHYLGLAITNAASATNFFLYIEVRR